MVPPEAAALLFPFQALGFSTDVLSPVPPDPISTSSPPISVYSNPISFKVWLRLILVNKEGKRFAQGLTYVSRRARLRAQASSR